MDPFANPDPGPYAPRPVASPPVGGYQPHHEEYMNPYDSAPTLQGGLTPVQTNVSSTRPLPSPTPTFSVNDHHYDPNEPDDHDTGDIPLLQRSGPPQPIGMPGQYDDDYVIPDDRSENNIRYGRIPQRVPRRYKTMKKVK